MLVAGLWPNFLDAGSIPAISTPLALPSAGPLFFYRACKIGASVGYTWR